MKRKKKQTLPKCKGCGYRHYVWMVDKAKKRAFCSRCTAWFTYK